MYNININTLLDATGKVWIYRKDMNGKYLGCNALMASMLNFSSSNEICNKTDDDLPFLDNKEKKIYKESDKAALQKNAPAQFYDTATLINAKIQFLVIKMPWIEHNKIKGIIGFSFHLTNFQTTFEQNLTKREQEVLSDIAKGRTAKQIAYRLHISSRTAEHHIAHIKRKLKVSSKSKLIEIGQKYST